MEFEQFRDLQRKHVEEISNSATTLFAANVDKDLLWNTYLDAFPPGTNEIFRERREFDCSCCRHFIKNFGNVVALKNGEVETIWNFETRDSTYQPVIDAMHRLVSNSPVDGVFVSKETIFGTEVSRELRDGTIISWKHFQIVIPKTFAYTGNKTIDSIAGEHRTNREVFERSLQQISIEAIDTALDLISQNSLYKGEEWRGVLEKFLSLKKRYNGLDREPNNWLWEKAIEVGPVVGRLKNHSIGTFLLDLSEGVDLEAALRKYEVVVAPTNYKRPQAVFTAKMVEEAKKTVIDLGLEESLPRRFATLRDVSVNDVLFADRTAAIEMKGVFDKLARVPVNPKKLNKVEEVSADKFLSDVLPRATSLEVLVENKHIGNLVSLIAPQDKQAPTLFKWGNNFSWAYTGNITDSMKERVATAGGKIDGVLRFSIQWNDDGDNQNDFDAHCVEPNGNHIYYGLKNGHQSTGALDVDIIHPDLKQVAVENITWSDKSKMREGVYHLYVHNYSHRGGKSGFAAEIEYGGEIHQFEYRKDIRQGGKITVAKIRFSKKHGIEFIESLPSSFAEKTMWGITTNHFVPVLAVMHSPNHWGENAVGNRHVIFALKNCVNDTTPNGFFNEFLKQDLMAHKRVFEALGREMRVEPSEDQLSGLGFATTKRNSVVLKVGGTVSRTVRVLF